MFISVGFSKKNLIMRRSDAEDISEEGIFNYRDNEGDKIDSAPPSPG